MRSGIASPIGALIRNEMKARGLTRPAVPAGLSAAWIEAVGPGRAPATRLAGFRAGVLTVEIESAPLRCELEAFHREDLVERLRVLAPAHAVRRIAFRPWGRRGR